MSRPAIGNRPPAILPDVLLKAILVVSQPKSIPSSRRRLAPMSLSRSNFPTPQALADWLRPRLPSESFASWGVKPGTKNIHNLWLELSEGETSLADASPPLRTVNVVTVRVIGNDGLVLVESRQEMSDGSVRDRFRPLSEKMKPGEIPEAAVARAVSEELGSENVKIVPGSYRKKVEERNSMSYPGLPACYVLHSVDAVVEGLPEGEFCTEEDGEYEDCDGSKNLDRAISVRKHYWKWGRKIGYGIWDWVDRKFPDQAVIVINDPVKTKKELLAARSDLEWSLKLKEMEIKAMKLKKVEGSGCAVTQNSTNVEKKLEDVVRARDLKIKLLIERTFQRQNWVIVISVGVLLFAALLLLFRK